MNEQQRFYSVDASGNLVESWAGRAGRHYREFPRGYDSGVPDGALMTEAITLLNEFAGQFIWPTEALELVEPTPTQRQVSGR